MKIFQPVALSFMLLVGVASNAQAADALTVTGNAGGTVVEVEDRLSIRNGPMIEAISADGAMSAADDVSIPTTAAVKVYVDAAQGRTAYSFRKLGYVSGLTANSYHVLKLNSEVKQDSHPGAYGSSTGHYTAPLDGLYSVSITAQMKYLSEGQWFTIYLEYSSDGGETWETVTEYSTVQVANGWHTGTQTVHWPLTAGEQIRFVLRHTGSGSRDLRCAQMSIARVGAK